jgi:hypothetical protein
MGYYSREQKRGTGAAVVIHLAVYCAVAGCFAYGLHALFAPTRLVNPGVSAYKAPPQTVINYAPARPQGDPQPVAPLAVSEPEPPVEAAMAMETKQTKEAAPAPAAAEKPKRTAKRQKPRPTRSAKVRRNPRRDYAYQPFFWGGYRPWW